MRPTTPGEMLREEWMLPLQWSCADVHVRTGMQEQDVRDLVSGNRDFQERDAHQLAMLGTTPEFWLNMQEVVERYRAQERAK